MPNTVASELSLQLRKVFIVLLNVLSKRTGACHVWVQFVVGSRPCSEGFSPGSPVFLNLRKTNTPNANSMADVASSLNIVIYFYFSFVCILKCLID